MKACTKCGLHYPNDSTFCFVDGATLDPLLDQHVGTTLSGRYLIEDVLGEGGMATVYRARHKLVDRPCAVKILNPSLSKDRVVRERFRREAKAAQRLSHPNIIEIFDQGESEDGTAYLVMELLEGTSLAHAIGEGPMPLGRALPVMIQIARALARAHDFGVVHRDLKPENVFLSRRPDGTDLAKLLDFGIARSAQDARLTSAGEVFGTPQYMAPERITSIDAGAPSDLYALGVLFYEMLTGVLPFDAPDIPTFFLKHLKEPAPPVRKLAPTTPEALERLLLDLMAKDPRERPVDAHRVHGELVAIARAAGVAVPPDVDTEEPSSRGPAPTLPPVAIDRWARRTLVFAQMLTTAYGQSAPPELMRLLEAVRVSVREVTRLRSVSLGEQRDLGALEQRGRDGRQRFGFAVDALGVDASRARDEARAATAASAKHTASVEQVRQGVLLAQREVVTWEGRSGMREPSTGLRDAYTRAAKAVEAWRVAREAQVAAEALAAGKTREVADLEFQIQELRTALASLESGIEADVARGQERLSELDRETDRTQAELLRLATEFCAPLRQLPALGALFRELEADAA